MSFDSIKDHKGGIDVDHIEGERGTTHQELAHNVNAK